MPWKQNGTKVVYENAWIKVREDTVTRPDGKDGVYGVIEPKAQAVFIVAVTEANEICLIHEYRYPVGRLSWQVPKGGAGHEDKDALAAAKAELQEETGFTAAKWQQLGEIETINGLSSEIAIAYLATGLEQTGAHDQANEGIEDMRLVPFGEVFAMIARNEIADAQTLSALMLAIAKLNARN